LKNQIIFQQHGLCNYQITKLLNYPIALGLSFFLTPSIFTLGDTSFFKTKKFFAS